MPSNLTSWHQPEPDGGALCSTGSVGGMKRNADMDRSNGLSKAASQRPAPGGPAQGPSRRPARDRPRGSVDNKGARSANRPRSPARDAQEVGLNCGAARWFSIFLLKIGQKELRGLVVPLAGPVCEDG